MLKHGLSIVAAAMLACCAQPAPAQTVGVMIGSVHSNNYDPVAQRAWNNYNPGVYVQFDNRVVLGTYLNSIRKQTYYVGYAYPVTEHIDVVVGAISGYNGYGPGGTYRAKAVMPMVVPSVHFSLFGGVDGRVSLAVGIGKGSATAVNFAIERKF